MPLTRGEVLTTVKYLLRESNSLNLTYSAAELNNYFYEALKFAVKKCRWPQYYATATWAANNKEYALPDGIIEIFRVLVNGQRIRPTSIPIMEKDWKRSYDAEWTVEAGVTIPELSSSSDTALIYIGTPDVKYYIRGRSIGLSPHPTANYTIRIDGVWEPEEPGSDNTNLDFYEANRDVLVFKTMEYCLLADRKFNEANHFRALAEDKAIELLRQVKQLQGDEETKINPLPYREYWG